MEYYASAESSASGQTDGLLENSVTVPAAVLGGETQGIDGSDEQYRNMSPAEAARGAN